MQATRRTFTFGVAALTLSACSGGVGSTPTRVAEPELEAVPNPAYDAWVAAFIPRAAAQGIGQGTLDSAFRSAGYLPGVIERDRNQTEFSRTLEDYLSIAASDERIANGRAALGQYGQVLAEIDARYGVEPQVVVAVWGLESQYGARRGNVPVISALSTLAFDGRRGEFFEGQLIAALKILQNGDVSPTGMTGSWAGAMGHTQFIPTSYLGYAVDFRGDGRRDIWSDDPTDALASTAAYLAQSGWTRGQPWGVEVQLPDGFNTGLTGRGSSRSVADWTAQGVRDMSGRPVPDYGVASIIIPSGSSGPAFMTFRNFTVITRYNNSESYVIGIGHLSDRLRGGPPVQAAFPPDANGMTKADRQDLQRRLTARGFDTQGTDGVIGRNTMSAISAYQASVGLPVTGQATMGLLAGLRYGSVMSKDEKSLTRFGAALLGDALSAVGIPGGSTLSELFKGAIAKRQLEALDILGKELAAGNLNLEDADVDAFVLAILRFSKAVDDGVARDNLRLLAKVIVGLKKNKALSTDSFSRWASILSDLSRDEILAIGKAYKLQRDKEVEQDQTEFRFWQTFFKNMLRDEAGATAIEYGLIAALIAVAIITALQGVGNELNTTFGAVESDLDAANG